MITAITRDVSPRIAECELTYLGRMPIDAARAQRQLDDYRTVLERHGAVVEKLRGDAAYPDSCFVEDTAIVLDEVAVLCNLGVASRQGETGLIARVLSKFREVVRISPPATIEGGDVLRAGRTLFAGLSTRTNREGIAALARLAAGFGYKVIHAKLGGSLHLKSACTAIDDDTLLLNPNWADTAAFRGYKLVSVPEEEPWAANVLRVNTTVCVQDGFPRTAELVAQVAQKVELVDTSELMKAEGALTCLSILIETAGEQPSLWRRPSLSIPQTYSQDHAG